MTGPVFDIPEQILRNMPDEVPGTLPIQVTASGPLRPANNQPTSSTFKFQCGNHCTILQTFPRKQNDATTHILAAILNNKESKHFTKQIETFLLGSGAEYLGKGTTTLKAAGAIIA